MNARKEVTLGQTAYYSAKTLSPGQELSGVYTGSAVSGKYNTITHYLSNGDDRVGINGTGKLNKLLSMVSEGANITIKYLGEGTISKGASAGKPFHDWKVFVNASAETPDEDIL